MDPRSSYDPDWFTPLAAVEDRHFWFRSRNRVIGALAARIAAGLAPGCRVLEVGCGTGNVLRVLEQTCPAGAVVGMDLFGEGLDHARRRARCPLLRGDLHQPPFRARFALIGMFDVLEHLADDAQALRDLGALLEPGGVLMLSVPAHPALWSYFDEASGHHRRYREEELRRKLVEAGYRVQYVTPYMAALLPLMWLGRSLCRGSGREAASLELRVIPVLNELLRLLLAPEAGWIARRRRLPFGASLLAVATAGAARP